MRSSKSRSRSKTNRPRTLGNIINRVFDSSGPEGKVRGTPQQIIEKYQMLARDAQLSNDRVAAENFLQHAEHYTRLLAEAMREMAAEQESRSAYQNGQNMRYDNRPDQLGRSMPLGDGDQPDISGADMAYADAAPIVDMPDADRAPRGYPPRPQRVNDNRQNEPRQNNRPRDDRPRDDRPREDRPREDRPRDDRPREDRRNDRPRQPPKFDASERAGVDPSSNDAATHVPQPSPVQPMEPVAIAAAPFVSPADLVAQLHQQTPAPKPRAPRVRRPATPSAGAVGDADAPQHPPAQTGDAPPAGQAESA